MNNQHKVFIIGCIVIIAFTIPYTLLFMAETPPGSEEESNNITEDEETEGSRTFPEDYLSNISSISYSSGASLAGTLESLSYKDGDTLDIEPGWNGGEWEYDIRFKCSDLSEINLEFYDLWLYLDIDDPVLSPGIAYLQACAACEYMAPLINKGLDLL